MRQLLQVMPYNDKNSELYGVYANMKARCYNHSHPYYRPGVKVCGRWLSRSIGFANFIMDMGPRPAGAKLERRDPSRDFSPQNCYWVSPSKNVFNRRMKSTNKSGVTGVYFNARVGRWHATITVNKRRKHLGWFESFDEAVYARALAEARMA